MLKNLPFLSKVRISVIVFMLGTAAAYANFCFFEHQEKIKVRIESLQRINDFKNQVRQHLSNHFHLITFIKKFIETYNHYQSKEIKKTLRIYNYQKDLTGLNSVSLFKNKRLSWTIPYHPINLSSKQKNIINNALLNEKEKEQILALNPRNGLIAVLSPLKKKGTLVTIFSLDSLLNTNRENNPVSVEIDLEDSKNKKILDYYHLKDDGYYTYDSYLNIGKKFILRFFVLPVDNKNTSYWVLIFGVLISSLVSLLIHSITKTKNIAKNIAKKITDKLRVSEEILREAQAIAHVGNLAIYYKTNKVSWSDEMFSIFGIKPPTPRLENILELVDPADREKVRKVLTKTEDTKKEKTFDLEFRIMHTEESRWVRAKLQSVHDKHGNAEGLKGVILDISDYKKIEEKIKNFAFKDSLTGLRNRACIEDIINKTMNSPLTQWPIGIIFIDLDKFKSINDSLGHTVGDIFLKTIAERLSELKRSGDILSRLNGDEFILFMTQVATPESAKHIAERLLLSIRKPITIEGREYHITASIGIAFAEKNIGCTSILRNADLATVRAKDLGRNIIQFYLPEMSEIAAKKAILAEEIRRGIANDEFLMFYQPRIELENLRIVGAEALMRWNHPKKGIVSPNEFIEVAEEQGIIEELGKVSLEKSCSEAAKWRMAGHQISLAVNISAKQFAPKSLIETITSIVASKNLPTHALELEITESAAMKNPEEATEAMNNIKSIGVSIALDDFGTGYSSLAYLKRFPLDFIKIDQSFVRGLPNNQEDCAISNAICALGHSLKLRVIAEGVESMEQVALMKSWAVDEIQGYIISKPLPLDEFMNLLKTDFRPDGTWIKFDEYMKK
ncbi:putative signalling protein, GGDEF and EAL domain [Candidatus Ichthyocystis hellenicum]|uniref:Putative signalling protein, GGDEF and EAL domain n=1 Tax=Candidatus Ichthyocystis hellenicum TaxID=1561003 RepID=A0A0S4M377_9BURK|nr:GGDEF domain-containing phosphodiesterase [Candidatus Ichthyocystis hellenicum]CUT17455.1 putative signalling protein, GGDEF and EAL domain [Candidatus Ichthyocystis hellenicum]